MTAFRPLISLTITMCLFCLWSHSAFAGEVIFADTWADGGLSDGDDESDVQWKTIGSKKGIEVKAGSMGLVSGTSGRGVHALFPKQELNQGDSLKLSFTFTTPATVTTESKPSSFRVGLFDPLDRDGLAGHVECSTASPNEDLKGLPGYMMDMDVATGSEDLNIREHDIKTTPSVSTGRLMGVLTGFNSLDTGPDGAYEFKPNTTYDGSLTIERVSDDRVKLTARLDDAELTATDQFDSSQFGMVALHVNSNVFGSTNEQDVDDNGIEFSKISIEMERSPE